MTDPTFTIVIPTYNRCELVRFAIESALRQTFADLEIVVSDNHSTDATAEVVGGFMDPRLRYVRPPEHRAMPEHWEFARQQARGELVLLLGDDDALVADALERFAAAHAAHGAELLFSGLAEYFDPCFDGPESNSLLCMPFTGATSTITVDDLLGPLYRTLRPRYRMDPSAFVFSRGLADRIAAETGHFFFTQGAEYYAWPLAAVFANHITHVSLPLLMTGRTPKSWGTNMVLVNPGRQKIDAFLSDVVPEWSASPLSNFTFSNLMAEGLLAAKGAAPDRLARYELDTNASLRAMYSELLNRRAKGVDVERELAELEAFASRHPEVGRLTDPLPRRALRRVRRALRSKRRTGSRLHDDAPDARAGFRITGAEGGFDDILGAGRFLAAVIADPDASFDRISAATRARQ
jgi:hypothetical protein